MGIEALRASFKMQIYGALGSTQFIRPEDFRLNVDGTSTDVSIRIYFLDDENLNFEAKFPHELKDNSIKIQCNPGEATHRATLYASNHSMLINEIQQWVVRIQDDLSQYPEMRAYEKLTEQMADFEKRLRGVSDTYATSEQIEKFHELLNKLEGSLKAQIQELEISMEEKERRLNELQAQFEELHKKANQDPKVKQMFRWIASRFYRVASDPKLPQIMQNGMKLIEIATSDASPMALPEK